MVAETVVIQFFNFYNGHKKRTHFKNQIDSNFLYLFRKHGFSDEGFTGNYNENYKEELDNFFKTDNFIYYASMGLDHASQKRSLKLFCEEVLPAFQ